MPKKSSGCAIRYRRRCIFHGVLLSVKVGECLAEHGIHMCETKFQQFIGTKSGKTMFRCKYCTTSADVNVQFYRDWYNRLLPVTYVDILCNNIPKHLLQGTPIECREAGTSIIDEYLNASQDNELQFKKNLAGFVNDAAAFFETVNLMTSFRGKFM